VKSKIILLLSVVSLSFFTTTYSQELPQGIDPQINALYNDAMKALADKDYNRAINIYTQAIRMSPNNIVLRRDLAYAYYLNGQYDFGLEVVNEVIAQDMADPETYRIASALESAKGNDKKSAKLINEGLKKYPHSGLLYNTKGTQLLGQKKPQQALQEFLTGIDKEASFPGNYLQASKLLLSQKDYIWASIYAEIYILLDPESMRTNDGKRVLLESIREMYAQQGLSGLPTIKNTNNKKINFASALENVWLQQFIVLTDNQGIDNIIMFRTRVLLDWMSKYPLSDHSLFLYHDRLLEKGYFEAYNYFLFGAIDDSQIFRNWVTTHAKINNEFQAWIKNNPYAPSSYDPKK